MLVRFITVLCWGLSFSLNAAQPIEISNKNFHNYLQEKNHSILSKDGLLSYKLVKKIKLHSGISKNKYALYYLGLPVYGYFLNSSEQNAKQRDWHGMYLIGIERDLTTIKPKYSKKTVLELAKKLSKLSKSDKVKNVTAELYIRLSEQSKAELVYLVNFLVEGKDLRRPFYIISALTGKVVRAWDGLAR